MAHSAMQPSLSGSSAIAPEGGRSASSVPRPAAAAASKSSCGSALSRQGTGNGVPVRVSPLALLPGMAAMQARRYVTRLRVMQPRQPR